MAKRRRYYRRRRMGRKVLVALILGALVGLVVALVLRRTLYVIKEIQVVGSGSHQPAQIVALSGVKLGESIFDVNEEDIAEAFSRNGEINFDGLEKHLPSTIRLNVRERVPRVRTDYVGLLTIIDENGYVIEQARELPENLDLPRVTGLKLKSCEVGRLVTSELPYQIEAMNAVVTQVYARQVNHLISELNVSDLDNLYLMTRSGMMVKLGNMNDLQNKLIWMNTALTQLTSDGVVTGVLDVTSGKSAVVYQGQQPEPPVPEGG